MDLQLYEGLKFHAKNLTFPRNITNELRLKILNTAKNFHLQGNVLYWIKDNENRRVAKATELESILYNGHSSLLAGHFDANGTYQRLRPDYYWPRMFKTIEEYVKTCASCQRRGKPKRTEPLHPIPVGEIFDRWGMDIVGPISETRQGNKYIIVATEYLTKWPEAQAIPDTKAKTVAKFFYEQVICRYGAPKVILTDQGSSFANELIDSLCEVMGSKHKLSTAYHPQTNGLTERFNKTLCETIAKYILQYDREWDQFVQSALFAYRTKIQSSTKFDPFFLMYGRKAKTPLTMKAQEGKTEEEELEWEIEEHVNKITSTLEHVRDEAKKNITKSQQAQKERFDKKIKIQEYNIGDQVLMFKSETQYVHGDKFREFYTGPYYIHQKLGNGSYKLRDMKDNRVCKKPINGARLKKHYPAPNWESTIYIEN
jgi:transposase InsO family protein